MRSARRLAGLAPALLILLPLSQLPAPTASAQNPLSFQENSVVLGGNNFNRTKDADVGDINNDGFLDLYDGNSNNVQNGHDIVIRMNDGNGGFVTQVVGPRDNAVSYDSDLVDLDGDGFPDLIRTESPNVGGGFLRQIAVYPNLAGAGGVFFDLANPSFVGTLTLCPDDIAFGDLNGDGLIDFAVTERIGNLCASPAIQNSDTTIFLGTGSGLTFTQLAQQLPAGNPAGFDQSTHDVIFLDANDDGTLDLVAINELSVPSRLWLSDGAATPTYTLSAEPITTGYAAAEADFDGDGTDDFVVGGRDVATVYLNAVNGDPPGDFTATLLTNAQGTGVFYDMELGDIDADGDIDIIGVGISSQLRVWLNDGDGSFTDFGGTNPFPGHAPVQRLSGDLIDYDRDGDLDFYVTGGDGGGPPGCFGCNTNQFFENLTDPPPPRNAAAVVSAVLPLLLEDEPPPNGY